MAATILVVDDEDVVREMAENTLGRLGFDVATASNAEEALEIARSRNLKLVITDVVMPRVSGTQLAERLQELLPEVPVLFVSGHEAGFEFSKNLPSKAYFLPKPFSARQLEATVELILFGEFRQAKTRPDA